ncbi:MAG: hypothetical protein PF545_06705 [Elusimicrobia bacterium]|nr:hypothetical protein [Elusimicrobiota bacterium]
MKKVTPRLYELMVEEGLSELIWEEKDNFSVQIKRKSAYGLTSSAAVTESPPPKKEEYSYIYSPMNGIFFDSSRPGEDSFVKKGKEIKKDTTVCIIEAMKLMNEVRVEKPCRIKEVMVKNAESVQIKQPLFKITEM